jgi:methionyl-tRNA formyltransferase
LAFDRTRIALFGLTGFGNAVLRALLSMDMKPELLVTRREAGPYPYYTEIALDEEADRHGIRVAYGSEGERLAASADYALISTYHRILPDSLLTSFRAAVNLHPSLLPAYRGPAPCYWVIRNGENVTGITAHLATRAVDDGPVILQRRVSIAGDETQGTLRYRLAQEAGALAVDTLKMLAEGFVPKVGRAGEGSYYPRPEDRDFELNPRLSITEADRLVRAACPWPCAHYQGLRVREARRVDDSHSTPSAGTVRVRFADGFLDLYAAAK